jgi:hypothetical protein
MMNYILVPLHNHEERYGIFRSSWLYVAPRIVFGIAWTLIPFILFFPILRLEWYGFVLLFVIGIFGLRYSLAVRAGWYGSVLVVTSERVIDVTKKGFGEPVVTSVSWNRIDGVRSGIGNLRARILRLGIIYIDVVAEPSVVLELPGVKKPALVMKLICEVQSRHTKR